MTGTGFTDIRADGWIDRHAPAAARPYLRLMRADRPIGVWLLLFPCLWSLALAGPEPVVALWHALLFLLGAIVMRGAGCTINDILDRDLDARVERTAARPLASGQIGVRAALVFLAVQLLLGLAVLLQFNGFTVLLGASSLGLIALYPLMKRVTWWPQAFLGLVFNWGAMVGWASIAGALSLAPLLLYAGCIAWTIGYDTIYGYQDIEDDARIGVKSTSRLMGANGNWLIRPAYLVAVCLWAAAGWVAGLGWPALVPFGLAVLQLGRQTLRWRPDDPVACLATFKSNVWVGWLIAAAMVAGGGWPG